MKSSSYDPPTDKQINGLLLNCAVSGRLSRDDLDMLVTYILAMRENPTAENSIPSGEFGLVGFSVAQNH